MSSLALSVSSASAGTDWSVVGSPFPCQGAPNPGSPTGPPSGYLTINFVVAPGSIPTTATITGWVISYDRDTAAGGNIFDSSVKSTCGSHTGTNDYSTGAAWPSSTGSASFGTGTTDTWGTSAPTAAAVNAGGNSSLLAIITDTTAGNGYVRNAGMTVYYTMPDPFPAGYESAQVGQRGRALWPHLAMRGRDLAGRILRPVPVYAVRLRPISFRLIPSF